MEINCKIKLLNNLFNYLTGAGGLLGYGVGQDVGTAVATGVATAGGTLGVNKALGTLITEPKFINWLAKAGEIVQTNPTRLVAHINRLPAVALGEEINEDVKLALASYVDALGSSGVIPAQSTGANTNQQTPMPQAQPTGMGTQPALQ